MTTSRLTTADERNTWLASTEQALVYLDQYCLVPSELLYRVLQDADRDLAPTPSQRKKSAASVEALDQLHLELPE